MTIPRTDASAGGPVPSKFYIITDENSKSEDAEDELETEDWREDHKDLF